MSSLGIALLAIGSAVVLALGWGLFEARWVRFESLRVPIRGLPPELDGVRIVHLADFHLGFPSPGERAVVRAVDWAVERKPDLVLVSGDLLSRRRGERKLRRLIGRLDRCYVVLGNHDFAASRDPFSESAALFDLAPATLLLDESATIELRGRLVQIVGVDPRSFSARRARPELLALADADLRILLCHFPDLIDELPPGAFQLMCSGHLHDGQIALPYPGGKLRLSHPAARFGRGLLSRPAATLHLSAGLGTTFVPFRFFARPEASELVLQSLP
ncbi:MAG: metallophosphoesterase [Gaiellaceae bacterium]